MRTFVLDGAGDGIRTHKVYDRGILSPLRMPVPPRQPMELPLRIELRLSDYKSLRLPLADRSICATYII